MDHLLTEARNPASTNLDELSPLDLVRLMNAEGAAVAPAVTAAVEAIACVVEAAAGRMKDGVSIFCIGAGTSGRLGVLDAAEAALVVLVEGASSLASMVAGLVRRERAKGPSSPACRHGRRPYNGCGRAKLLAVQLGEAGRSSHTRHAHDQQECPSSHPC